MVRGGAIADVPITVGSLDPCFSCTERVEAVDLRSGVRRVYSQEDLLLLAARKGAGGGRR
jgi:hypothetical protein